MLALSLRRALVLSMILERMLFKEFFRTKKTAVSLIEVILYKGRVYIERACTESVIKEDQISTK